MVGGEPPERIYELVAKEAAALLGGGAAGILRLDGEDKAAVMGSWADHEGGRYEPGTVVEVRAGGDVAQALANNRPVRVDGHAPDSPVRRRGYRASIVSPVHVAGTSGG